MFETLVLVIVRLGNPMNNQEPVQKERFVRQCYMFCVRLLLIWVSMDKHMSFFYYSTNPVNIYIYGYINIYGGRQSRPILHI